MYATSLSSAPSLTSSTLCSSRVVRYVATSSTPMQAGLRPPSPKMAGSSDYALEHSRRQVQDLCTALQLQRGARHRLHRRPSPSRGERVTILRLTGHSEPFDLDRTYRVAVNSYRAGGAGGMLTTGSGIAKEDLPKRHRRRYLARPVLLLSRILPPSQGRPPRRPEELALPPRGLGKGRRRA